MGLRACIATMLFFETGIRVPALNEKTRQTVHATGLSQGTEVLPDEVEIMASPGPKASEVSRHHPRQRGDLIPRVGV